MNELHFPGGKRFAFTIFDDSDYARPENVREIYSLFRDVGILSTKSVWPNAGRFAPDGFYGGSTLEDADYLRWVLELQAFGFEIGFHNATYHSSERAFTIRGLERFNAIFGQYPTSMANHDHCTENLYWGDARFTGFNRLLYNAVTLCKNRKLFKGHIVDDPHFWGDVCKQTLKYVRNFVFNDINTLNCCPFMPYYDPERPYVNYWFCSSNGSNVKTFNRCIRESAQDQLEDKGGVCIMYTHLADGFCSNGSLDTTFKYLITRLAKKNGWFVPVSTLLDHLLITRGHHVITQSERNRLERTWLLERIKKIPTDLRNRKNSNENGI